MSVERLVMAGSDRIQMTVGHLTLDPVTKVPVVVLRDADNKINLPIWIGVPEATAVATELEGVSTPRPMTHDLMCNVLRELGAVLESIEVTDLQENTYFAQIRVRLGDRTLVIDSRPSDAIALAVRTKSPIFVAKRVLEAASAAAAEGEAAESEESADQDLSSISRDKWGEILEKMTPGDFKYKM